MNKIGKTLAGIATAVGIGTAVLWGAATDENCGQPVSPAKFAKALTKGSQKAGLGKECQEQRTYTKRKFSFPTFNKS